MSKPSVLEERRWLNGGDLTKKASFDIWKGNLKTIFFIESEGNVNITSKAQFPKLQTFYKGVASKIKEDGPAETKHYPPIDPESLKEIYTLGGKLVRVFEARESGSQEELTEAVSFKK